jgi:hypothetical protein
MRCRAVYLLFKRIASFPRRITGRSVVFGTRSESSRTAFTMIVSGTDRSRGFLVFRFIWGGDFTLPDVRSPTPDRRSPCSNTVIQAFMPWVYLYWLYSADAVRAIRTRARRRLVASTSYSLPGKVFRKPFRTLAACRRPGVDNFAVGISSTDT